MNFILKMTSLLNITLVLLLSERTIVVASHGQLSSEKTSNIQNKDLVTNLPHQPNVDFRHYAGYVTVNEKNGRALFYWFYEAWTLPDEKPLVLWLNGGPGCSSVGYGATQEIGPFIVGTDGNSLQLNPYSWNIEANMLFLESPVGVGFSYSNTTSDYENLGDDFTAKDTYAFLHNWFKKFPSYRTRAFYIAGESYAGKYVPELAGLIYEKNNDPSLFINLKGILLGNPETSDAEDWKGLVDYAWSHAVVSDETHKTIRESCDFNSNNTWSNDNCSQAVDEVLRQYKEIDIYSLYTSVCNANSAYSENKQVVFNKSTSKMMPRIIGGYDPCLDDYAKGYYNKPEVQKALHVSNGLQLKNWSICNMDIFNGWSQSIDSVLPIYKKLIDAKLRIWVYSGDTDGRVPVLSTRYSLSSLGLSITRSWRPWYNQKQVGGWIQEYEGLTFATFRGAGHAVPIFKPSESLAFFTSFLLGESPPSQR
ncbi:serine carboxypeptidase-like 31 [Cynara cardunculus var. scolymus]|uniref:serine carboxypeptidase-like 31 n=1 Tax=Cynara cardunculus var. scolymus TaxID=59895 RepID=UPI000D624602|nr:serine carboxypeptidase-like 31 [Cynara cardunculus var. scolymus]